MRSTTLRTSEPEGVAVSLEDKYTASAGRVLISGIEALVRLPLDQRRLDRRRHLATAGFISGYEGSPLGGVDLELGKAGRYLAEEGVVFQPGLNEELAATAVGGTQLLPQAPGHRYDGVSAYWYGKNPGLDRAADAIRHANYSGTSPLGGAVAWIGDDPAAKSSTLPSSCEQMAASLAMPLLAPGSVADVLRLGLHAVALSRAAGTWVGLKMVADIADSAATVELSDPATFIPAPDVNRDFHPPVLLGPGAVEVEADLHRARLPRALAYAGAAGLNAVTVDAARAQLGIVAPGLSYATLLRALDDLGLGPGALAGLGIRLVRADMPWPLDPATLRRQLGDLEEVLVVEDKGPFVEAQVKAALYGHQRHPPVLGALDRLGAPLLAGHGALGADQVAQALGAVLGERLPEAARRRLERSAQRTPSARRPITLTQRSPSFCSGCPHNLSTRAGDDQLVGLGIGCHVMVALDAEGRGRALGMTQMGGEGAQWIGLAPFTDDRHYLQNLGDGTFFHSGSLAVRAAVAAGVDITYKLLYNDAVAMTGGQAPEGRLDVPALTRWLATEGVAKVVVVTPEPKRYRKVALDPIATVSHRDRLAKIQDELAAQGGVSVLLYDDRCAAEKRRLRRRRALPAPAERVWINQRVCEGCGDCQEKSSCLSVVPVETDFGTKTAIHQGSCNHDRSCLGGDCPSFVLVTPGQAARRRPRQPPVPLVEPTLVVPADRFVARLAGVGGTGVVTVSRVLQMAAHLSGLHAAGVEQTGLAQKGGPVVADVRISAEPIEGALRASAASIDLYLGFDPLGAANPANLATADPGRTVAVIETATVPTARMLRQRQGGPAPSLTASAVDPVTRAPENFCLGAQWIAERLCEDHLAANVVLLGAAYQRGCLPLEAGAIEAAWRLNGVAVEENLAAFAWGRAAALDLAAVQAALAPPAPEPPATPLAVAALLEASALAPAVAAVVEPLAVDLFAYQNARYAERYLRQVRAVQDAEAARCPGPDWPLTLAVARGLHKLMAYKDEYEVARLHLDTQERRALEAELGAPAKIRVLLHPPVLRLLGLGRKVSLGPATVPTFRLLRSMRRLRGTPLDPFGHTRMRRAERALATEYLEAVKTTLEGLSPATLDRALAMARLPQMVRGYESVKWPAVERFRDQCKDALALAAQSGSQPDRYLPGP